MGRNIVTPITNWNNVPVVMDLPYAARIVGVTPEALKQRCLAGNFPAYKEGKAWRVEKEKLRQYMNENCVMQDYKEPTYDKEQMAQMIKSALVEMINPTLKERTLKPCT